MSIVELQRACGTPADGAWGPKSRAALWGALKAKSVPAYAALISYLAGKPVTPTFTALAEGMAAHFGKYGIDATPERLANFLGQAAHESGCFRYMREIWGPTPAQARYEGRRDLGNVKAGDGFRYLGRGIFQLTGRGNYRAMSEAIGIELEDNPHLAENPNVAVWTACEYWRTRNLSEFADTGKEDTITRRINGGINGLEDRRRLVAKAKKVLV